MSGCASQAQAPWFAPPTPGASPTRQHNPSASHTLLRFSLMIQCRVLCFCVAVSHRLHPTSRIVSLLFSHHSKSSEMNMRTRGRGPWGLRLPLLISCCRTEGLRAVDSLLAVASWVRTSSYMAWTECRTVSKTGGEKRQQSLCCKQTIPPAANCTTACQAAAQPLPTLFVVVPCCYYGQAAA